MFRVLVLTIVWTTAALAAAPTTEQTRAVLARLGREADQFERNAHRFVGVETLEQVQPEGTRYSVSKRGLETRLPATKNVVVSEYGFISSDEPGGSLREVRSILTVNGLKWKRGKKDLKDLATQIARDDSKNRVRSLERFEDFGLRGFLQDAGQLILLFARSGTERYEFTFHREDASFAGPVWVYKYRQIDGPATFTIYGQKEPIRQRLEGEVWLSRGDGLPVRVAMHSNHSVKESQVRDVTVVDYEMSRWGFLLPSRIDHKQFVDGDLFVADDFTYKGFREVVAGRPR
jgi:hypothetical protein